MKAKTKTDFKEALTADGEPFDSSKIYYFYDQSFRAVKQTIGLKRQSETHLFTFGLPVIPIDKLREKKASALDDGIAHLEILIADLRLSVENFEGEKLIE